MSGNLLYLPRAAHGFIIFYNLSSAPSLEKAEVLMQQLFENELIVVRISCCYHSNMRWQNVEIMDELFLTLAFSSTLAECADIFIL